MEILVLILEILVAVLIITLLLVITNRRTEGTLLIDTSDEEKDIYRFVIDESVLDKLTKKKCITLKIDPSANLSQDKHTL